MMSFASSASVCFLAFQFSIFFPTSIKSVDILCLSCHGVHNTFVCQPLFGPGPFYTTLAYLILLFSIGFSRLFFCIGDLRPLPLAAKLFPLSVVVSYDFPRNALFS